MKVIGTRYVIRSRPRSPHRALAHGPLETFTQDVNFEHLNPKHKLVRKEGLKELVYFTEIHEQPTVTGNYHSKESTQNILHFIKFNIGIFCEQSLAGTSRNIGWVHETIMIMIIGQP